MRVVHLACVGRSQNLYRVVAIRDEHDVAVTFLAGEVGDVRRDNLVGFVAPWVLDSVFGNPTSEKLDLTFVWDTRLQAKVVKKTGPF